MTIDVNGTPMRTWVVLPEGGGKAPVVVVIQEVFGLADWIRGVADQLAKEGFIAVAPDLLAGKGPNNGDSRAFANQQEAVQATLAIPAPEVLARIKAAREWGVKHARSNGKTASVGFCFGGSQSFALAVGEPGLSAAVVYYGSAPSDQARPAQGQPAPPFEPSASLANIKAPVLGLFGGLKEDARIGATIAPTEVKLKELEEDVRVPRVRRRRAWFPAGAGWEQWGEPEGVSGGVAEDHRLDQEVRVVVSEARRRVAVACASTSRGAADGPFA